MVAGRTEAAPFKTTLHKALIGAPSEATLRSWKAAGFEGMESTDRGASPEKAAAARKMAEKLGMKIHSRALRLGQLQQPDQPSKATSPSVETALRACQGYGADAVLLVPCRIGGMPMPEAWEFDIELRREDRPPEAGRRRRQREVRRRTSRPTTRPSTPRARPSRS